MREDFGPDDDFEWPDRDDMSEAEEIDWDISDFEDEKDDDDYDGRHEPGCDENGTMWD